MQSLDDKEVKKLEYIANEIRITIIKMLLSAGSGHTAGPLDMADIFTALYFHSLRHDPKNPNWNKRDRLVLSNGHICPVLYATMAHAGYFDVKETLTLRKFGSRLQGHPHREWLPGIETSSGPLGSGLSQAVGMAIADRIDNGRSSDRMFYCLTGDGELNCGQIWEAAMLAGKERLGNLVVIVDRNNIQIDGFTEDVMPLESLVDKWRSFNFQVQEINGHDFEQIIPAINQAKTIFDKPSVIIAHTIASKGVAEFERDYKWHGKIPSKEEAEIALKALRTFGGRIKNEHLN
jgi:transketolase